ncbi:F0F1 ATP synthase subunit B [Pyruvatibacter sp.]|uniref:F0F1 ATP synthase subunit B n=1 Tax=Pyruvatibacter sp. TaxID=1981328 RepID=UPI0032EF3DB5
MADTSMTSDYETPIILAQNTAGETSVLVIGEQAEAGLGIAMDDAQSGGMPQLDFSTFAPQLIWLLLTFGVLYFLMSRVALPRVAQALEIRRDRIANDLDQAAQFKAETDAAIEGYETALAEARAKAHQIASDTREELGRETDALRDKLEAELDQKLEAAEARITATKTDAMSNVRGIAADVAAAVVAQLGISGVDAAKVSQAVDAELKG